MSRSAILRRLRVPAIRPVVQELFQHFFVLHADTEALTADHCLQEALDSEEAALQRIHAEILRRRGTGEVLLPDKWRVRYPGERVLLDLVFAGGDDSSLVPVTTVEIPREPEAPEPPVSERNLAEPKSAGQQGKPEPDSSLKLQIRPAIESQSPRTRMGRYELQEPLGQGGFGSVWLARDPTLDRLVAIKMTRPDKVWLPEIVTDFIAEGRRLAQLRHPGIVSVFDVGVEAGDVYIVSEFIDGGTLERRLELPFESTDKARAEAVELIAGVAEALHVAHSSGIVHRDIKPANILLDRQGRPHVTDFGIAASEQEQLEESASTLGTFAYMAPEQLRGDSHLADGRADIYSLGVLLYRMLTGKLPFLACGLVQHREVVLTRDARPPRSIVPEIDPGLERICLRCLAKLPQDRYTSVIDLARELRATLATPVASTPRRIPTAARVMIGISIALLAVGMSFVLPRGVFQTGQVAQTPAVAGVVPGMPGAAVPQPALGQSFQVAKVQSFENPLGISEWSIEEHGQTLKIISSTFTPLELGIANNDVDLDFRFLQPNREGRWGLLFGYGLTPDRTRARFQALRFQRLDTGELRISLGAFHWKAEAPSSVSKEMYGSHVIPWPAPGAISLAVQIRAGKLSAVMFDGKPLTELVRTYHQCAWKTGEITGVYGVWCENSSVLLTDPRLNTNPAPFCIR